MTVYVPKNDKLRAKIIRLYYDTLVKGHGKQQKMVELVTRNFWWPGVTKEIKQYCQRAKLYTRIKLTALCLAFNKENSIEFPLDFVHYLYIKSNPNPSFYPTLPYKSFFSCVFINKKIKKRKYRGKTII